MGPAGFKGESTNIILSGSMAAGRHGTGALAETLHVEAAPMKLGSVEMSLTFEISMPSPTDTSPPTRPRLFILPNSYTNWEPKHSNI